MRGECEVAAVVFQCNVHGILSDHHGGIEAGYRFREAASEDLKSLIVLVKMEHNEDCRSIGTKPVGRFYRHDLVSALKTQFLVESFCRRNGAEQALRRSVEIVGNDVLGTVLKIGDGGILDDRQLRCLECRQRRQSDNNDRCDRSPPYSPSLLGTPVDGSCQG